MAKSGRPSARARHRPDELLTHGPFEVARFGRNVFQRANWRPGEHEEFLRRGPANAAKARDEVARDVARLVELVKGYEPLRFVHALMMSNSVRLAGENGIPTDAPEGSEARAEYAQSLVMAVTDHGQTTPTPDVVEEFCQLVEAILNRMPWYFIIGKGTAERNDVLGEFAFMMLMRSLFMRGSSFEQHETDLILAIFTPHNDWLRARYGLATEDVLDGIQLIQAQVQNQLDAMLGGMADVKKLHDEWCAATEGMPEAEAQAAGDSFMQRADIKIRVEDTRQRAFETPASPVTIDASRGKLATLLPLISARPGENRTFLEFSKSPAWPTNDTIITSRPIVALGGSYICPNAVLLYRQRMEILMGLVRREPKYLQNSFAPRRSTVVEALALNHLRALLPGAVSHANAFFRPNGPRTEPRLECDGVMLFDGHLFLIEAKAGDLTPSARRGSVERLKGDLRELVHKAHTQTLAAKAFVESSSIWSFEDAEGIPIFRVPDVESLRGIYMLTVTLSDLSGIATRLNGLKPAGLIAGRDWPWVVFLNDLRVISEVLESPAEFILYLERRIHLNDLGVFAAGDELDYLGFFLNEGLYFERDDVDGIGRFLPVGFTSGIDNYFENRRAGIRPPKPCLKINADYRAIVRAIEASGLPERTFVAKSLLGFSSQAHEETVKSLDEIALRVVADRRGHSYTALTYGSLPVVFGCSPEGNALEEQRIRSYAEAKCLQVQAKAVICVYFSVGIATGLRTFAGFEVRPAAAAPNQASEGLRLRALERYRREHGEPERNTRCPCGTGKKFKACCMDR